ncbi:MAG: glyoxalase/bleomycin resistance/dioxygenase family protein, partial [Thiohalorhabdaceae bacterium]
MTKTDYAKWELTDPAVNFAISARGRAPGVDHPGFQVSDADGLAELEERARSADGEGLKEAGTTCCYAVSDKYWVTDPQGLAWETYHTLAEAELFTDPAK